MAVRRGEVYFVNFNPSVGREQAGRRPAVIVSSDAINSKRLVVLVVPGTSGSNITADYPTNVRVPAGEANLPNETVFMTFQMRAIDHSRFADPPVGRLSEAAMSRLEQAMAVSLDMAPN
jgi:mRNA interferase MazF